MYVEYLLADEERARGLIKILEDKPDQ